MLVNRRPRRKKQCGECSNLFWALLDLPLDEKNYIIYIKLEHTKEIRQLFVFFFFYLYLSTELISQTLPASAVPHVLVLVNFRPGLFSQQFPMLSNLPALSTGSALSSCRSSFQR